jgi:hypothetical protein
MTLGIDIQLNSIECHYAECRDYLNVMLSVVSLNVVMVSVVARFNEPSLVENAGDDGNADVSKLDSISPTFYKTF